MEKEEKVVKVCPIVSTVEMAIVRNKLDNTTKGVPRFIPMGCIGSVCLFYNEEMKQCNYILQTILLSNITNKLLKTEIEEAQCQKK